MISAKENNSVCVGTKESTVIGFYRFIPILQTNQSPGSRVFCSAGFKEGINRLASIVNIAWYSDVLNNRTPQKSIGCRSYFELKSWIKYVRFALTNS
jgi:hypothetical protein